MASKPRFTDMFIKRPVLATVISLIILLVGLQCLRFLPLRQYPLLQMHALNVHVTYPGASPELVEKFITTPIESSLSGIDGVDYISSKSSQGSSDITIYFVLNYDVNRANTSVTNAVSAVRFQLPSGILDPIINARDPNATPILYLSFSSDSMPSMAIGAYLTQVVMPQLENLDGVSDVGILTPDLAMRLWLDPKKMAAQNITASEIGQAVKNNHVQGALGRLNAPDQLLDLQGNTDLQTAEQFNVIPIKTVNNQIIRLQDVGNAILGADNYEVSNFVNGKKTSMLSITPTETGNPLTLSETVEKLLPSIQKHLPKGMSAKIVWNTSLFISASLHEVVHTLIIASLCVLAIIFLFLGSIRSMLIPCVTIPLSLFGVCAVMYVLGYSLNTLTLLAWVLAIGLVVDDAIYVLENIYRHIEEGSTPLQAALVGTREISFAVIAMTLTLAAVYAPIGFLSSMTGVLFREFAFTLAGAVIVSGVIALTLSPMMCAQLLQPVQKHSLSQQIDMVFLKILKKYQTALRHVLRHPKKVVGVALFLYASAGLIFHFLPSELAPDEDQGIIFTSINTPTGSNLHYIEQYTNYLTGIYQSIPERANFGIVNNPSGSSSSFLSLKPWDERSRSSQEIIEELAEKMKKIPGLLIYPSNPPALPGSSGNTRVSVILKSTGSWASLEQAAQQLKQLALQNTKLRNVYVNMQSDQPIINFDIDRNKASSLGINMADLSDSLNILFGEPILGYFSRQGEVYPIIPQVYAEDARNPSQLASIPFKTSTGQSVPLGSFTQFTQSAQAELLPHFQKLRAISITANLTPGYTLGEALTYLNQQINQHLPRDIEVDYSGASRTFMDSQGSMSQLFIFSMLFIFLVLAAQFESFRDPLIIMIAVPLSLFGALLVMLLTHCTLNIYTEIGLVTLIGLMSKHSILMVEFANQILPKGKSLKEAAFESASIRFRPILMTTMAMVLGALPLIFAGGAGSVARQQLGWVIVGGMGIGTLCTLFIIPTVYMLIATHPTKNHEHR